MGRQAWYETIVNTSDGHHELTVFLTIESMESTERVGWLLTYDVCSTPRHPDKLHRCLPPRLNH